MIYRRSLLALSLIAGCVAGGLYLIAMQRVDIVVATRDISVIRVLSADDLELRSVPPDALPPGVLFNVDEAIGRVPVAPLWQGQPLVARALTFDAALFHTGLTLPAGQRAVALPVNAAGAVGGTISPGARVDVLAIPTLGRAPAGRTTELLVVDALVLDIRGESGTPYTPMADGVAGADRIGSVVIAIPAMDELRVADRIATSSFVLAFSSVR